MWIKKHKPYSGRVYKSGKAMPEPNYETATGRTLYTVAQMHAAYEQGAKDERSRCRYPECVDENEDGRCSRWLSGECGGPIVDVDNPNQPS